VFSALGPGVGLSPPTLGPLAEGLASAASQIKRCQVKGYGTTLLVCTLGV